MDKYVAKLLENKPYFTPGKRWVSPFNYVNEAYESFANREVFIYDVTLRDGEQTLGVYFDIESRVRIAEGLAELGVDRIEAGMPATSQEVALGIKKIVGKNLPTKITAFCRALKKDIDIAADCGVKSVVVEHNVNPFICKFVYGMNTREEIINRIVNALSYARELGMEAIFMGWDLTRCVDLDFLKEIYTSAVNDGKASSVILVDTYGVITPQASHYLVKTFKSWLEDTPIEYHVHNDFGLAVGASLSAVEAGASWVHTALNGLGERSGNTPTEEMAGALEILLGIKTGVNLKKINSVSRLVADITKTVMAPNKPIVGENLFFVETGAATDIIRKLSNQDGVKIPTRAFMPEMIGHNGVEIALGKGSGQSSIQLCLNLLGVSEISDEKVHEVTLKVKEEGRIRKSLVKPELFVEIVESITGKTYKWNTSAFGKQGIKL